jgi:quercetin 2,3-dioxygenase
MKKIIHRAFDRGIQDHGWLRASHSFSFANYHDPAKMNFGLLRVLNDDIVAPAMGFGAHEHDNMEIVTIPLRGALAHKDSLGSEGIIKPGEIQIMSAGTGIRHSEFNASDKEEVNLLQIWVLPKVINIGPRYDQRRVEDVDNGFKTVISPIKSDETMWINQDAFFTLGNFVKGQSAKYTIKHAGNGAYVFLIEGSAKVDDVNLEKRDAVGIYDADQFDISINEQCKILIIEVPMQRKEN